MRAVSCDIRGLQFAELPTKHLFLHSLRTCEDTLTHDNDMRAILRSLCGEYNEQLPNAGSITPPPPPPQTTTCFQLSHLQLHIEQHNNLQSCKWFGGFSRGKHVYCDISPGVNMSTTKTASNHNSLTDFVFQQLLHPCNQQLIIQVWPRQKMKALRSI